jgi:hypothetical protein
MGTVKMELTELGLGMCTGLIWQRVVSTAGLRIVRGRV